MPWNPTLGLPGLQAAPYAGPEFSNANPNDPMQRQRWAEDRASYAAQGALERSQYLTSADRRRDNISFFSGLANRTAGGAEELKASLASQGLLGANSLVSKFQKAQERDRMGKAFMSASQQTIEDERQAQGLLGTAGQLSLGVSDSAMRRAEWDARNKPTDFLDVLGKVGGTLLGAVTGGAGAAIGVGAFNLAKGLFGGSGGGSTSTNPYGIDDTTYRLIMERQ